MNNEKKYISLEAVVNVEGGLGLRASYKIVKECMKYEREIYFVNDDGYTDCKSILALIGMGAEQGTELKILVEGEDETAKRIASRLCSGVASKDKYDMRFEDGI